MAGLEQIIAQYWFNLNKDLEKRRNGPGGRVPLILLIFFIVLFSWISYKKISDRLVSHQLVTQDSKLLVKSNCSKTWPIDPLAFPATRTYLNFLA